ncbi:hypothetical protein NIIDMKKI_34220 [Mycobacterium kansasii]|uniref:TfoX N-terminal domain-containing protein n=1 Tax=Mycobacterium kansasii TaxID=1768 RepID=A0A7G1IAZ5_MYCKA|nr:hypothetical protein NIIDMKKI_34220 [Mycobacterium kansasii]
MAYDIDLVERIRELLASQSGVDEKRMFGGLAFLIDGHLAVAVSGQGGLLVRCPGGHRQAARWRPCQPHDNGRPANPRMVARRRRRSENQTAASQLGHAQRDLGAQPAA